MPLDKTDGQQVAKNLSVATLIKDGPGRVVQVSVLVPGAAGALHDCAATGDAAASNQIAVVPVPAATGPTTFSVNMPFLLGLVYVPGAAQTASISYN